MFKLMSLNIVKHKNYHLISEFSRDWHLYNRWSATYTWIGIIEPEEKIAMSGTWKHRK